MNARDIEAAAVTVETARRRALSSLVAAGVVAMSTFGVVWAAPGVAVGLAAGVIIALVRAGVSWFHCRELVERLALDPSAYAIPEVARFGGRVANLTQRRLLAESISSLVHDRGHPLALHLGARTRKHAEELDALARELAAPSARIEPATAVACRRLVTRPVQSPLYNPNLPEEDLTALLLRLRGGISFADRPENLASEATG
jgi:hypothetical protein